MAAITDAYASVADYKARYERLKLDQDAKILADLTTISRLVDKRLRRHFTKDAAAVSRSYTVEHLDPDLFVDDLAAAPSFVKLDLDGDGTAETALAATDYQLWPLNAGVGPEPAPYQAIRLTPWGDYGAWTPGMLVTISAQWGWPAVPTAIRDGVVELTAILRIEGPRATQHVSEDMDSVVALSPAGAQIVHQLLNAYERRGYS